MEIHDHREKEEVKVKRIIMKPTAESIWTDINLLSESWGLQWTEEVALELEAQILVKCCQMYFMYFNHNKRAIVCRLQLKIRCALIHLFKSLV